MEIVLYNIFLDYLNYKVVFHSNHILREERTVQGKWMYYKESLKHTVRSGEKVDRAIKRYLKSIQVT